MNLCSPQNKSKKNKLIYVDRLNNFGIKSNTRKPKKS